MIKSKYTSAITDYRNRWWELAPGCVAAYQPKGADSYQQSLINLANPGVGDAYTAGADPGWDSGNGWTFNGSQHLKSVNDTVCVLIRFVSTHTAAERMLWGVTGARDCYINRYSATQYAINNGESSRKLFDSALTEGVVGYSGAIPYMNGTALGSGLTSSAYAYPCGIGACLRTSGAVYGSRWIGSIQAIAAYNIAMPVEQVVSLTAAMNAL